jgi:hypothetical protein
MLISWPRIQQRLPTYFHRDWWWTWQRGQVIWWTQPLYLLRILSTNLRSHKIALLLVICRPLSAWVGIPKFDWVAHVGNTSLQKLGVYSRKRLAVWFPAVKSPLYLMKKLARWSIVLCALALVCRPSIWKKFKKKKKKKKKKKGVYKEVQMTYINHHEVTWKQYKVCGCYLVRFSCSPYRLDLHNKTCATLANLRHNICKNQTFS